MRNLRSAHVLPLLLVGMAAFPAVSQAVIYVPGQNVPHAGPDVFTWGDSAADSTFAFWDDFSIFVGGTKPGFIPIGATPAANSSFDSAVGTSLLTFQSNQSLTGGGNAYGGTFGGGAGESSFITKAFATVRSGTSGGPFTRIVAQFETLGSELHYPTILLSTSTSTSGTMAPSFAMETARVPLGGTFGGEGVSYLALWDLDFSQTAFRIDFSALENNVSFDKFRVDSFTQQGSFLTPTAVPEPRTFAALAVMAIGGTAIVRRRRRSRVKV